MYSLGAMYVKAGKSLRGNFWIICDIQHPECLKPDLIEHIHIPLSASASL